MKSLLLLLALLVLCTQVQALGIAPANEELVFESGKEINLTYRIYNTLGKDFTATVAVNGTLARYIELDRNEIHFSKDDKYKTVLATVRFPKRASDLKASIIVSDGSVEVIANIDILAGLGPTGGAIKETGDKTNYILPLALLLIVVGNIAYFSFARQPKHKFETPKDLLAVLKTIDDKTFVQYVNGEKNEFADWLDEINMPELALRVYDITNRQQMIRIIEGFLALGEQPLQFEELGPEIAELKRELDSFEEVL